MQLTHDKKLLIATGSSRKASNWQNKELMWSEFLDKLAATTRTRETVAEYAAMAKGARDDIKDVGGFVGGYLKNGKRNNASVVNRCLVCLDIDHADPDVYDDLDMTFINAYALYSTHSHTPEKMRLRLIIPLSRPVSADEYAAVSRRIAADLTLSRFDPTTFEPARLMYWPSTPEDGEFVFRYSDETFLDPDTVLATYVDWHDTSLWPTTRPLEERTRAKLGKQEDPLTKRGIIGAFCRAHSITNVLETILADKYTPTGFDDGQYGVSGGQGNANVHTGTARYTFVGGSTTGGLVVYDDKYAFSHHATDPAGEKLCNAFDLVRYHLFTPGQECATGNAAGEMITDEQASMKAMQEYTTGDEATKRQLAVERQAQAVAEFGEIEDKPVGNKSVGNKSAGNKPAVGTKTTPTTPDNTIPNPATANAADPDWESKLEYDKQGKIKDTLGNLACILRNDPRLKDISYNIHRSGIDIRRSSDGTTTLPWMEIFQIVKENCTSDYKGATPQEDAMELLLRSRNGS